MSEIKDDDLRGRFSALKQQDRRHEPRFQEVLDHGEQRDRDEVGSAPTLRWVAAAACIVIAAGAVIGRLHDRGDEHPVATGLPAITN